MAPRSHHYSPPPSHSGPRLLPGPLPFLGALPWIAHSPATPFRELAPTTLEHELWIVWIERYPAIFPSFCPLYFFLRSEARGTPVVSCSDHSYSQYALDEGRPDLEGERGQTRYLTNPLAIRGPESQIRTYHKPAKLNYLHCL